MHMLSHVYLEIRSGIFITALYSHWPDRTLSGNLTDIANQTLKFIFINYQLIYINLFTTLGNNR